MMVPAFAEAPLRCAHVDIATPLLGTGGTLCFRSQMLGDQFCRKAAARRVRMRLGGLARKTKHAGARSRRCLWCNSYSGLIRGRAPRGGVMRGRYSWAGRCGWRGGG
jgi:hypothetical protein